MGTPEVLTVQKLSLLQIAAAIEYVSKQRGLLLGGAFLVLVTAFVVACLRVEQILNQQFSHGMSMIDVTVPLGLNKIVIMTLIIQ